MIHPELFLLIGISFSMGFTPGPNNAVASYSGFNFGIKKTIPLIFGVGLGYTLLVIIVNFVLISIFQKYPILQEIIRTLGTIFLLYLAYKIAFSSGSNEIKKENPVKFIETFLFQYLNPKGVMVGIIVVSTYVELGQNYFSYATQIIVLAFLFSITSITLWTVIGKFLRKFATNDKFIIYFNYVMSGLLLLSIITFYI